MKKEKIVFSTLLAKNTSIAEKLATKEEWHFIFSSGKMKNCNEDDQNKPDWITTKTWFLLKR